MTKENKTKTLKVLKKVGYFILSGFVALIIIGIIATIFESSSVIKELIEFHQYKSSSLDKEIIK